MNVTLEDMREHGGLLMLKQKLVSLIDSSDRLDIKTLALFQLKDFIRDDEKMERQIKDNLLEVQINSKDAIKAMDYRQ